MYKIHIEEAQTLNAAPSSIKSYSAPNIKTITFKEVNGVSSNGQALKVYPIPITIKSEENAQPFEEQYLEQDHVIPCSISSANVKSEKIVEEHQTEVSRINSFADHRLPIIKNFKALVKIEDESSTFYRKLLPRLPNHPQPMIKISLNKPSLNAPLVVPMGPGNSKPRAPATMVVNSVCPSPYPIRKDCCHKCKIIFNHTLDFLLHKYGKHPKRDRTPRSKYKYCSKCFKTFKCLKSFLNHRYFCTMRIHNYFECSGCSQGFDDYQMLKGHLKTCVVPLVVRHDRKADKRTFACDMCDKKFSRKGGVTQHKNSFHFNIKPFVCRVCGHKYALKGDLTRCRHKKALMNSFVQNYKDFH